MASGGASASCTFPGQACPALRRHPFCPALWLEPGRQETYFKQARPVIRSRQEREPESFLGRAHPRGEGPEAQAPSADCSGADLMGEAAVCSTAALRSAISSAVRESSASSSRLRRVSGGQDITYVICELATEHAHPGHTDVWTAWMTSFMLRAHTPVLCGCAAS